MSGVFRLEPVVTPGIGNELPLPLLPPLLKAGPDCVFEASVRVLEGVDPAWVFVFKIKDGRTSRSMGVAGREYCVPASAICL